MRCALKPASLLRVGVTLLATKGSTGKLWVRNTCGENGNTDLPSFGGQSAKSVKQKLVALGHLVNVCSVSGASFILHHPTSYIENEKKCKEWEKKSTCLWQTQTGHYYTPFSSLLFVDQRCLGHSTTSKSTPYRGNMNQNKANLKQRELAML